MSALPALGWGFLGAVSWGLSALCWSPAIRCGIGVWPMLHWVFVSLSITAAGGAILIEGAPVISSTAAVGAVGAGMLYAIGDALFFRAVAAWLVSLVAPIVACSGAVNAVLAVMSGDTVGAATAGGLTLMVVGVVAVAAGDFPEGDASSHRSRPLWRSAGGRRCGGIRPRVLCVGEDRGRGSRSAGCDRTRWRSALHGGFFVSHRGRALWSPRALGDG